MYRIARGTVGVVMFASNFVPGAGEGVALVEDAGKVGVTQLVEHAPQLEHAVTEAAPQLEHAVADAGEHSPVKDLFTESHATPAAMEDAGPKATVGWSTSSDYRATFAEANPDAGEVWVHHAVEQQILGRHPGLFNAEEIHSVQNLRGIPEGEINNTIHLSEIRKSWNEFYRNNPSPTREDVLAHASSIDRKLGIFFSPPVM